MLHTVTGGVVELVALEAQLVAHLQVQWEADISPSTGQAILPSYVAVMQSRKDRQAGEVMFPGMSRVSMDLCIRHQVGQFHGRKHGLECLAQAFAQAT